MKINIVGGGPAGLYLAILAKKLDPAHEIAVFERDPADNTYGWGIVLSQRTMASLRGADFETYLELMESAQTWEDVEVAHKGEGTVIGGNDFSGIRRIGFLRILQKRCTELGVQLNFEAEINALDNLADCDLLVGADGIKSMVRSEYAQRFLPHVEQRRNKYVWYGTPKPFHALTMMFHPHNDGIYIAHAYKIEPELSTFIVECDPDTWERGQFADRTEVGTPTGITTTSCSWAMRYTAYISRLVQAPS
jgi:2-polyprenyl-6-methoxyphenol hydroxylase-like FAD-dependent oxidoreductase